MIHESESSSEIKSTTSEHCEIECNNFSKSEIVSNSGSSDYYSNKSKKSNNSKSKK